MGENIGIVIPCVGNPFIQKDFKKDCKQIQNIIEGYFDFFRVSEKGDLVIHPLFVEENKFWANAQKLINIIVKEKLEANFYVNENGRFECVPNFGVLTPNQREIFGVDMAIF